MHGRGVLWWLVLAGLALALVAAGPVERSGAGQNGWLEVEVRGLPGEVGQVMLALFNQAQGFPDESQALRKARLKVREGRCQWRVEDLPPGQYALAFYQDLNGVQRLETNWLGIPKVPYGFSGVEGLLGPPDYSQAKFNLVPGANRQVLTPR